ncbi:hypothetical protein Ndes2526B_g01691 [Nannochloris sp. 'desiccata']|nr:hypothetical protein KSW81_005818 [Chlorella desiccata (nom. nud.)]KAH7623268.1 hypothetical protein NADE_002460 [Chlorella desiccata (nom. nud.)]
MARKIILAIDDSDCSISAAKWACETLARPGDELHLVGCQGIISAGMGPALPAATAGSVAAFTATYHDALKQEEQRVKSLLTTVKNEILKRPDLHLHSLPAAGGASGVGESIVSWAKHEHADLVVLGSRGMGAVKSTFMSVVGLGSVSEYCLHHVDRGAVAIVHGTDLSKHKEVRKVLVAVDDSHHAQHAQKWCIENVLGPKDELHIVSVALPVPYVAGVQAPILGASVPGVAAGDFEAEFRGALEHAQSVALHALHAALASEKIAADDAAAAHVLEVAEEDEVSEDSREYAQTTVKNAVEFATEKCKVDKERVFFKALEPEGGASDISLSIKHYQEANGIDVVVVGSRGMGAVKRALFSLVGLGSVSDWCAHNMSCPVIVIKGAEEPAVAKD